MVCRSLSVLKSTLTPDLSEHSNQVADRRAQTSLQTRLETRDNRSTWITTMSAE